MRYFLNFPIYPTLRSDSTLQCRSGFDMYQEGLIDALDCENFYLGTQATSEQIEQVREHIESVLGKRLGDLQGPNQKYGT